MRTFAVIAILALLTLSGCKTTKYVPVETVRTERIEADTAQFMAIINTLTEQLRQSERTTDSLIRDHKINVTVNERGDTVRIKETEYVYISSNRERELEKIVEAKNDTIQELRQQLLAAKADSVPTPYPVEKELTRWQQAKMDFGGMSIGAIVIVLCAAVVWLIKKFR